MVAIWRNVLERCRHPSSPAKAGIQRLFLLRERHWVPAFAGTTGWETSQFCERCLSPLFHAYTAACVRSLTLSLPSTLLTCVFTVFSPIPRRSAIS